MFENYKIHYNLQMRFIETIRNIFRRFDFEKKSAELEKRIIELRNEEKELDTKVNEINATPEIGVWYSIHTTQTTTKKNKSVYEFQPPIWRKTTSMEERQVKRIKAQEEHIRTSSLRLPRKPNEIQEHPSSGNYVETIEKLTHEEIKRREETNRLKEQITTKKQNANTILDYLRTNSITRFYHFTDERNLPSIQKLGGLYSWNHCKQNNITIPNPGGNQESRNNDRGHGLEDYVRLSFCDDHPMAYRLHCNGARLVLLEIKVDVAVFRDTLFSDINAADSNEKHGGQYEDLCRVNIEATKKHFLKNDDPLFKQHQAECMVKTFVPIEYITNINNPRPMHFNNSRFMHSDDSHFMPY